MTIEEAMKNWKCTKQTVQKYINKSYILGLEIRNNEFYIPEIDRPYVKRNPQRYTVRGVDERIKKALDNRGYINYKIMEIDEKFFEERMQELERIEAIRKKESNSNNYSSTQNFVLCSTAAVSTINFSLCRDVNITDNKKIQAAEILQVGGVNTAVNGGKLL